MVSIAPSLCKYYLRRTSKHWSGMLTPSLAVLSLKEQFPSWILFQLWKDVRILDISRNYPSGQVPDLRNLSNLQVLDMQDNSFGPHFPSLHTKVVALILRINNFHSGTITQVPFPCLSVKLGELGCVCSFGLSFLVDKP